MDYGKFAVTLMTCVRARWGLLQRACSRLQSCSGVEYRYCAASGTEKKKELQLQRPITAIIHLDDQMLGFTWEDFRIHQRLRTQRVAAAVHGFQPAKHSNTTLLSLA